MGEKTYVVTTQDSLGRLYEGEAARADNGLLSAQVTGRLQ
jgi:hypothetical protein